MKASAALVLAVVRLMLGVAEPRQMGMPAPPPQLGQLDRPFPKECPEPFCPEPVCPEPVCPPPVCPTLPPLPQCPPPAPVPKIPPCPNLSCPEPVCPKLPPAPPCPSPSCPQPVCPQPLCPPAQCSACPACPSCPTANVSCPQPVCPPASCPSVTQACPAKAAACSGCLWKVLVTYDHFQGMGFYKAYKAKVDWHQAKALCAADGGHLAVINSDKEAEILKLLYHRNELSGWIFIGFHDMNQEGKYETIFGEPLSKSGYMKWGPGQPDNFFDEDCGTIEQNALLNDGKCDWKTGFICEVTEEKALGQ